jgi:hypothetical protein
MSSGAFEAGRYATNNGDVYACRAQPESKGLVLGAVTNAYPIGAVTQRVRANLTGSALRNGVTARRVRIRLTAVLAGYLPGAILTVPIFQQAMYEGILANAVGTYLGTACIFIGRTAEGVK